MIFAGCVTAVVVVACVSLHQALLSGLRQVCESRIRKATRIYLSLLVLGAIAGHLVEIGLFGVAIEVLAEDADDAWNAASTEAAAWERLYGSAVFYTSLGGATPATRPLRLLASVEALTGLVLISWTASFLFVVMQEHWRKPP